MILGNRNKITQFVSDFVINIKTIQKNDNIRDLGNKVASFLSSTSIVIRWQLIKSTSSELPNQSWHRNLIPLQILFAQKAQNVIQKHTAKRNRLKVKLFCERKTVCIVSLAKWKCRKNAVCRWERINVIKIYDRQAGCNGKWGPLTKTWMP